MGRMYMPVEVSFKETKRITIAVVDTGADETVVSKKLATELGAELYGSYSAVCASGFLVKGKYANLSIKELGNGKGIALKAGVSDTPFYTDDINDEGLNVILGVDFIQETGMKI